MKENLTRSRDTSVAEPNGHPTWATEVENNGELLWSRQSEGRGLDIHGDAHRPVRYRGTRVDGTITETDKIYPILTDLAFSIPEARRLAEAILELCNIDEAGR